MIVVCDGVNVSDFQHLTDRYLGNQRIEFYLVNFGSAAKTRNEGLTHATSPWVAFWDCDDRVNESAYLTILKSLESSNLDLFVGQLESFDDFTGAVVLESNSESLEDVATFPAFTRIIYRRSFIGELKFPEIPLCEDQCFLASLIALNPRYSISNQILYSYRVNNPEQSTNKIFNIDSHFQAVMFLNNLKLDLPTREIRRSMFIFRFRLLISMLKRSGRSGFITFARILIGLVSLSFKNPWILNYVKPRISRSRSLPNLILVGGLGNQLFQYVFMLSKFGHGNFSVNINLGRPRISSFGKPDIFNFKIPEQALETSRFLKLKVTLFSFLLKLSSHGRNGLISRLFYSCVDFINFVHSKFYSNMGLVYLADGIGYFEDNFYLARYRYYVGCFHSYRWRDSLDEEVLNNVFTLKEQPTWLTKFISEFNWADSCVVHIRRGDYLNISNLGYLPLSYYEKQMRILLNQGVAKHFLIFSDDQRFVRSSLTPDLLSLSRLVEFDQEDASANLVAMRFGESYILSNSTFSWWGATLAERIPRYVAVPSNWYLDGRTPRDIYPKSWTTVGDFA